MAILAKITILEARARGHMMRGKISKLGWYLKIPKKSFLAIDNFPEKQDSSYLISSEAP